MSVHLWQSDFPPESLTPNLIAAQARQNPRAVALVAGSEQIDYEELERRASQLANHLLALGAGPEIPVGLCLERSPDFVIAAYAIMKCGAAYLPVDPAHPQERLCFIFTDAAVPIVVTSEGLAEQFQGLATKLVKVDTERALISQQPVELPQIALSPGQLAYLIYTSGSSGQPKGVEVTHANLANLIAWHLRAFAVGSQERATLQAGVGFDAAVWEIWPSLAAGAALYIPNEETRLSPDALREWLVRERITISFVPTAIAEQLIASPWPECPLRFLLTGADTLHRHPVEGLPFKLVNNYGPTECTVVTTSGVISPARVNGSLPPIGRPIDHVSIHILDEHLQEIADGSAGEICIGGAGVARGYRNRPDLTARQFVPNPFDPSGGRLYRTGDSGHSLPNGEIAFLGRLDDQVKIRGYRIELNEINAVLNDHPAIQASVVIAREDLPGEKRLAAYLVPVSGAERDETAVREWIRERLPDYMEPASFIWMDALPLTPNGKVDRASLPPPGTEGHVHQAQYIAPRTPVEETLAAIIAEVLGIPRISVDDDFFALGGHSLLGAQVVARVRVVFGAELRLLDVFDAPTVAELSQKIEESITSRLDAMTDEEVNAALAALNGSAAGNAATP